ncbi:hypothetical protein FHX95_004447 [Clostridium saccharobutylicum]|nr:hypothetical protein [Clostridium saccharobutylicum]NSB91001.1 hypothetical protein [Clostridium saccharobutylicum]NYC30886.1 hypothetical protein [Clostridium saccharobutylicum]
MPSPSKNRVIEPFVNGKDLNKLRGTIGSLTFSSMITNSIRAIAETAKKERMKL